MSGPWAVRLEASASRAAAELRLRDDVRAALAGDSIWLHGDELTDELDLALRKLGGLRYAVSSRGELTLPGERTPCATLPSLEWVPLSNLIAPQAQVAAFPGWKPTRAILRLARGGPEREPNVLRTTLTAWAAYAVGAPLLRLRRLSFAADARANVIVRGAPLPPVRGERYVEEAGVATPCGFQLLAFSPSSSTPGEGRDGGSCELLKETRALSLLRTIGGGGQTQTAARVDAAIVATLIGLAPGDLALMRSSPSHEVAVCEVIPAESFVAASRSAVRLTLQGVSS